MTPDITCPFCEEEVPIRIRIMGDLVDEYISIGGFSMSSDPIPQIDMDLDVDLEGLARDIDDVLVEKNERMKRLNEAERCAFKHK